MAPPTDVPGHCFSDPGLLEQALTHRSAAPRHNERLEFLGDGLVNLVIAEALFKRWPTADEGVLTRARSELVRERSLAGVARRLGLGACLQLGPGEIKAGGRDRDSTLADALEAVVAAVYLDAGFECCRRVVLDWFATLLDAQDGAAVAKDAKTRLQEWLQGRQQALPAYDLLEATGEDHEKRFRVGCTLEAGRRHSEGAGRTRQAAEQVAAQSLLLQLEADEARERAAEAMRRRRAGGGAP